MNSFIDNYMIDTVRYFVTKSRVYDTLESAHWYLVYSANSDAGRMEAAALIDRARRELLEEITNRAIDKHKLRLRIT